MCSLFIVSSVSYSNWGFPREPVPWGHTPTPTHTTQLFDFSSDLRWTPLLGKLLLVSFPWITYNWFTFRVTSHTQGAKRRDRMIVRAQKKVPEGRPNTPPRSCGVVTDPQVSCGVICDRALNGVLFWWILLKWLVLNTTSRETFARVVSMDNLHLVRIQGHFTHKEPRAVTVRLWEPNRKCPKAVLTHLQHHVVWSRILKCRVESYVTGFSIECCFNGFLFIRVLTHDRIEWINGCERSECHGLPVVSC